MTVDVEPRGVFRNSVQDTRVEFRNAVAQSCSEELPVGAPTGRQSLSRFDFLENVFRRSLVLVNVRFFKEKQGNCVNAIDGKMQYSTS